MKKYFWITILGTLLALIYLGAEADFVNPAVDELSFFRACSIDVCQSEVEKKVCQKLPYNPYIYAILERRFGSQTAEEIFSRARSKSFFMECY